MVQGAESIRNISSKGGRACQDAGTTSVRLWCQRVSGCSSSLARCLTKEPRIRQTCLGICFHVDMDPKLGPLRLLITEPPCLRNLLLPMNLVMTDKTPISSSLHSSVSQIQLWSRSVLSNMYQQWCRPRSASNGISYRTSVLKIYWR
jgi:hypothetical protein